MRAARRARTSSYGDSRPHGPDRVVRLVVRIAEERHQAVADELVDRSTVLERDFHHRREVSPRERATIRLAAASARSEYLLRDDGGSRVRVRRNGRQVHRRRLDGVLRRSGRPAGPRDPGRADGCRPESPKNTIKPSPMNLSIYN